MPGPAEPAAKGKESARPSLPRRWVSVTPVVGAALDGGLSDGVAFEVTAQLRDAGVDLTLRNVEA